jgi:hypothetical protein
MFFCGFCEAEYQPNSLPILSSLLLYLTDHKSWCLSVTYDEFFFLSKRITEATIFLTDKCLIVTEALSSHRSREDSFIVAY